MQHAVSMVITAMQLRMRDYGRSRRGTEKLRRLLVNSEMHCQDNMDLAMTSVNELRCVAWLGVSMYKYEPMSNRFCGKYSFFKCPWPLMKGSSASREAPYKVLLQMDAETGRILPYSRSLFQEC